MSITAKNKKDLIKKFSQGDKDSGSVEVQCAILTTRIENLTEHFKKHSKDFSSRRGLLVLVGRRRRLLDYLKSKSQNRYESLIKELKIRK